MFDVGFLREGAAVNQRGVDCVLHRLEFDYGLDPLREVLRVVCEQLLEERFYVGKKQLGIAMGGWLLCDCSGCAFSLAAFSVFLPDLDVDLVPEPSHILQDVLEQPIIVLDPPLDEVILEILR